METQGVVSCERTGVYKWHACAGAASARNTTNTNPPQGREKSPNLPSNYPDFAISSHQQSQAGGSENPPTRPQIDPDTTQFSYNNSGRQCIHGVTTLIGYVEGNGYATINIHSDSEAALQTLVDLLNWVSRESHMGDGHACTGAASARNTINTNPPQGRGESPNLPSSYPDIATSSHEQSQAARIMNPGGSENPPTRPQIDPDTTQFSYNNSGRQCIRGVTNLIGYVKGNGNGNINILSDSQAAPQTLVALLNWVSRESHMGDGTRRQPNSSSTTLHGENHQPHNFSNTGNQTVVGLANQIGIIDGDDNGNVNWE
ncbi:hypothetical protein L6164_026151 [Bauhinia variegata]|uniref:Uncharacterized protein n=1 Tax=Bauhinia variegata TaxID=167791 RepID=A0ACB9LPH5_BAUVA|nr:hypothetical protein L6164_026151 [Bauhinia variegata]